MLILHPAVLLKLSVLVISVWSLSGFLYIVSCHLHIMIILPLPFQFVYFSFFLSDCYGETFNTLLNRSGKSGHPCLFPDFSDRAFNFSPLNVMLAVSLL